MVKSSTTNPSPVLLNYPKLMLGKQSGVIILATGSSGNDLTGMIVHQGNHPDKVGYHTDTWTLDSFQDYYGKVTLEN